MTTPIKQDTAAPAPAPAAVEEAWAALAGSGLALEQGMLVRRQRGQVVARHKLETIDQVEVRSQRDSGALIFALLSAGGALLAKWLIPGPVLAWSVAIVLALLALLGLAGMQTTVLAIKTRDGDVAYPLSDSADQHQGFLLTLRQLLEERRSSGLRH